jgi:cytosolic 5'-nucleotidase 3
VIIPNQDKFDTKVRALQNLPFHIVTDFDKTLTKAFINGKKVQSSYSLLREGNYLNDNFAERSQKFFNEFRKYEDSNESLEFRQNKMNEWWHANWSLMKECGLSKSDLQDIVDKEKFESREGLSEFFSLIERIPVLIFSAGLGDLIQLFLSKHDLLTPNIHIVSNFCAFDETGNVKEVPSHFVHTLNKNEIEIKNKPYYQEVKNKENVILLGDRIDDLGMVAGIDHDIILKIGFYNGDSKTIEEYKKHFDMIITDDGTMEEVNKLLVSIL